MSSQVDCHELIGYGTGVTIGATGQFNAPNDAALRRMAERYGQDPEEFMRRTQDSEDEEESPPLLAPEGAASAVAPQGGPAGAGAVSRASSSGSFDREMREGDIFGADPPPVVVDEEEDRLLRNARRVWDTQSSPSQPPDKAAGAAPAIGGAPAGVAVGGPRGGSVSGAAGNPYSVQGQVHQQQIPSSSFTTTSAPGGGGYPYQQVHQQQPPQPQQAQFHPQQSHLQQSAGLGPHPQAATTSGGPSHASGFQAAPAQQQGPRHGFSGAGASASRASGAQGSHFQAVTSAGAFAGVPHGHSAGPSMAMHAPQQQQQHAYPYMQQQQQHVPSMAQQPAVMPAVQHQHPSAPPVAAHVAPPMVVAQQQPPPLQRQQQPPPLLQQRPPPPTYMDWPLCITEEAYLAKWGQISDAERKELGERWYRKLNGRDRKLLRTWLAENKDLKELFPLVLDVTAGSLHPTPDAAHQQVAPPPVVAQHQQPPPLQRHSQFQQQQFQRPQQFQQQQQGLHRPLQHPGVKGVGQLPAPRTIAHPGVNPSANTPGVNPAIGAFGAAAAPNAPMAGFTAAHGHAAPSSYAPVPQTMQAPPTASSGPLPATVGYQHQQACGTAGSAAALPLGLLQQQNQGRSGPYGPPGAVGGGGGFSGLPHQPSPLGRSPDPFRAGVAASSGNVSQFATPARVPGGSPAAPAVGRFGAGGRGLAGEVLFSPSGSVANPAVGVGATPAGNAMMSSSSSAGAVVAPAAAAAPPTPSSAFAPTPSVSVTVARHAPQPLSQLYNRAQSAPQPMGVRLLSVGDRGCTRWLLEQLGFTINRFWYLPAHSSGDEPQVNDDRDLMTTQLQPGGLREGWARNTTILEERHPATAGNMTIPEASPTGSVDIVVVCGALSQPAPILPKAEIEKRIAETLGPGPVAVIWTGSIRALVPEKVPTFKALKNSRCFRSNFPVQIKDPQPGSDLLFWPMQDFGLPHHPDPGVIPERDHLYQLLKAMWG